MEVKNVAVGDIRPYENNPRNNEDAVEYVANSIREFGWQQPIVVDAEGVIIAGHTRYKAAERLGCETVPVVYADDLTPEQVRAYRLADNKVAEMAGWDYSLLDIELDGIADLDMSDFGFEGDEEIDLDKFFSDAEGRSEKEPKQIQCPHCGEWFEA